MAVTRFCSAFCSDHFVDQVAACSVDGGLVAAERKPAGGLAKRLGQDGFRPSAFTVSCCRGRMIFGDLRLGLRLLFPRKPEGLGECTPGQAHQRTEQQR